MTFGSRIVALALVGPCIGACSDGSSPTASDAHAGVGGTGSSVEAGRGGGGSGGKSGLSGESGSAGLNGAGGSAGLVQGGSGRAGGGGSAGTGGNAPTAGSPNGGRAGRAAGGNGGSNLGGAPATGGRGGSGTAAGAAGAAAGAASGGATSVCTGTPAKSVTVYMIGDSTMSVYDASLYPRMGWGQPLGDLFGAKCATVVDKALSGRSSKSFFDEGAWTPIKNALKADDYVLIEFGHNDEKSDDATRYTEPGTTFKQYLTTYVTDTREKLAIPLLLTPINRNDWSGGKLSDTHGAYPPAVRELAAELDVELVDLTALTKTYFERLGQAATTDLFMDLDPGEFPNYPSGNSDNTHLRETGARAIGRLAMSDAYAQGLTLASYLTAKPTPP